MLAGVGIDLISDERTIAIAPPVHLRELRCFGLRYLDIGLCPLVPNALEDHDRGGR